MGKAFAYYLMMQQGCFQEQSTCAAFITSKELKKKGCI